LYRGAGGKKLIAAVKLWLQPDLSEAAKAVDDDLIALGAPEDVLAARKELRKSEPNEFEVHADNVGAFLLFRAMKTQWRWVTAAHTPVRVGFDYSALAIVAKGVGVKVGKTNFAKLQIMEAAALQVFRAAPRNKS